MSIRTACRHPHGGMARDERGAVMFVAIIVLLLMTLAGVAMMRQMRSDLSIAGNLAFKQSAAAAADRGTEAARAWFTSRTLAVLQNDDADEGYFSSYSGSPDEVDPAKLPWGQAKLAIDDDGAGNEVDYLIHRLCKLPNAPVDSASQECVTANIAPDGQSNTSDKDYKAPPLDAGQPFFRVTTRVRGPRNTLSYVQVVMY